MHEALLYTNTTLPLNAFTSIREPLMHTTVETTVQYEPLLTLEF